MLAELESQQSRENTKLVSYMETLVPGCGQTLLPEMLLSEKSQLACNGMFLHPRRVELGGGSKPVAQTSNKYYNYINAAACILTDFSALRHGRPWNHTPVLEAEDSELCIGSQPKPFGHALAWNMFKVDQRQMRFFRQSEIFLQCSISSPQNYMGGPLNMEMWTNINILQVCSAWQTAALNTPALWSELLYGDSGTLPLKFYNLWLSRAASVPVNLNIWPVYGGENSYWSGAAEILHTNCNALGTLKLKLPGENSPISMPPLFPHPHQPKNLRNLTIHSYNDSMHKALTNIPWIQLSSLEFCVKYEYRFISPAQLAGILAQTRNLTRLLADLGLDPRFGPSLPRVLNLPRLHTLDIFWGDNESYYNGIVPHSFIDLFDKLSVPALKSLKLGIGKDVSAFVLLALTSLVARCAVALESLHCGIGMWCPISPAASPADAIVGLLRESLSLIYFRWGSDGCDLPDLVEALTHTDGDCTRILPKPVDILLQLDSYEGGSVSYPYYIIFHLRLNPSLSLDLNHSLVTIHIDKFSGVIEVQSSIRILNSSNRISTAQTRHFRVSFQLTEIMSIKSGISVADTKGIQEHISPGQPAPARVIRQYQHPVAVITGAETKDIRDIFGLTKTINLAVTNLFVHVVGRSGLASSLALRHCGILSRPAPADPAILPQHGFQILPGFTDMVASRRILDSQSQTLTSLRRFSLKAYRDFPWSDYDDIDHFELPSLSSDSRTANDDALRRLEQFTGNGLSGSVDFRHFDQTLKLVDAKAAVPQGWVTLSKVSGENSLYYDDNMVGHWVDAQTLYKQQQQL
ncbi:hypothetical protein DFH08DRAFT_809896 [Mycena albidolilacea]|uniref:Uncharacterized protein n=1 Tax=Mycena albidolilacea TaxID=1033008 RepID=A0AAD6ZZL6_9AGAR|nr:hypothetical protein DFH08DRAFT_809896 [Mycena albidolilacea]